jgi:ADP-heptose:LPS heptosyltransferase
MKTEHILVIRFSAIGDVAMTVPVVYSLATQYPNVRITVLSKPFARTFFENLAPNVGFMEADIQKEYHGIKGLNSLYRRLTAKNFTAVADLHNVLRSDYLRMRFNLDRFKVAHVNKHRQERRQLTSSNNKVLKPIPSAFENYAKVFEELGYPVRLDFTSLLSPEAASLKQLPKEMNEKKNYQQWIGIAPFAAHRAKAYPLTLMEKVIDELLRRHPQCRIFLFGGRDSEKRQLDDIVSRHQNCLNVASVLSSLHDELVLMSHLDVMITMDSANMHIASLVGTPVVSIWGATHPYAGFMGWKQNPDNAVQIDLPCRPCSIYGNKPCLRKDYACLRNISPELIINKVERVIK